MAQKNLVIDFNNPKTIKLTAKRITRARNKVVKIRHQLEMVANDIDRLYLRRLRQDLSNYPPSKYRLRLKYSSRKQHDFVMFMWRTRKINLGTRTHDLAHSWNVKTTVTDTKIELTIETSDEKAQYVVGEVGIVTKPSDIKKLEAPIQPFAKQNRWRPAHTVITPAVIKTKKYVDAKMEEWENHLLD